MQLYIFFSKEVEVSLFGQVIIEEVEVSLFVHVIIEILGALSFYFKQKTLAC
jgi:hypothetical protein